MYTEVFGTPELTESKTDGVLAKITGRFISEGAKSANRRLYTGVSGWIEKANAKIQSGGTVDIRSHHEANDDSTRIVGHVTRLNTDGTYEGVIADTEHGRTLHTLVKAGSLKHVSLRAAGAVAEPMTKEEAGEEGWTNVTDITDFRGIDFTNAPGIPFASVGVMERDQSETLLESFDLAGTTPIQEHDVPDEESIAAILDGAVAEAEQIKSESITDPEILALNAEGQKIEAATAARVAEASGDSIAGILDAALPPIETEPVAETEPEESAESIAAVLESATVETPEVVAETDVEERGAKLSSASKSNIQAAIAALQALVDEPTPDPETQSTDAPASVTESADIEARVDARVAETLADLETRFTERVEAAKAEVLSARRRSRPLTESDEVDLSQYDLKDAITAVLGQQGKVVADPKPRRTR